MSVLFDAMFSKITLKNEPQEINLQIGHVNNIPTMQFFTGISRNTQSKSYRLSLTECVWEFQNNASWDAH